MARQPSCDAVRVSSLEQDGSRMGVLMSQQVTRPPAWTLRLVSTTVRTHYRLRRPSSRATGTWADGELCSGVDRSSTV